MSARHQRLAAPRKRRSIEWCPYCDQPMSRSQVRVGDKVPGDKATLHHVIPQRYGGPDTTENLRWCCLDCNQQLAEVDDCPGALAAARAILKSRRLRPTQALIRASILIRPVSSG